MENKLKKLISESRTIVAPGVYSPIVAKIAEVLGFKAVYFSGAAFSSMIGLPDLGLITLTEVCYEVSRISEFTELPLIVDIDTGYGEVLNVQRAVKQLRKAGASALQIEDQVLPKKCGHLPHKTLVPVEEMIRKIIAAKEESKEIMLIARTDARSVEGMDKAIERAREYERAGADIIFPEALLSKEEFQEFRKKIKKPLLANMTEFGITPYITVKEFEDIGYNIIVFPVTTLRASLKASKLVLEEIMKKGTQREYLNNLMERKEVYDLISYYSYEKKDKEILEKSIKLLGRDNITEQV